MINKFLIYPPLAFFFLKFTPTQVNLWLFLGTARVANTIN